MELSQIKALTFDVFGTVVDWRGSIMKEGAAWNAAHGTSIDWGAFADDWRAQYGPQMNRVRTGELPWTNLDELHRIGLESILAKYGIEGIDEATKTHLVRAWHRLDGWPDSVAGLTRLKEKFILATMSNGHIALMVNMAKHARLPWDVILGAEPAKHYKPDPETYLTGAKLLGLEPGECMMVAAHASDLDAAAATGLRTAYVHRPLEYGPDRVRETKNIERFDFAANSMEELATKLGC